MANCVQCGRKLPSFTYKKICQWCVQHEAAQRGEEGEDAKQIVMPTPWVQREGSITVNHVFFGANVVLFLAMMYASDFSVDFNGQLMADFGANYGPYTLSGQWWRLLTYMFLHGGLMHIAMNMWCLWNLGSLCESLYGRWTYAAIYVITGVAGGLASVGWNPGVLSVGASGALFGLSGALIASLYLGEFSLSGISIQGTLMSVLFFAGFSLFFGTISPGIDNAAHIGGLISGLILGALIARIAPDQHNVSSRVGVIAVVALAVLGATVGVQQWRGAPFRLGRAFQSLDENKPDQAIAQLQAIVKKQPDLVNAHFGLGQAYFTQRRFPESEVEFKRVVELAPENASARFNLGLVYLAERRPEEARGAFAQILARDANNADGHYGLGLALAAEGKHQAAIEEFKTCVRFGEPRGVYYELGNSYASLKMYDEAIASYLKEQERTGDVREIEESLADVYEDKGMTQQAQEARNKAAQLKGGR